MNSKGKTILLLSILWSITLASVIVFISFVHDKPKIDAENQQVLSLQEAKEGINAYFHATSKVLQNSSSLLPKP